nr:MFS transporter [uncultured Tateyamaria sp.]
MGALALGGAVPSVAAESWVIGLGRLFAGVGFLFTTLYFTKMVADWFEGREIATDMSVFVVSWSFGIAMGQMGHALLVHVYSWQVPFQAASIQCLIAALGLFLFYRSPHGLPSAEEGTGAALTG